MKKSVLTVLATTALLVMSACSPEEIESPTPTPSPDPSPTTVSASPTPTEPSPTPEPSPEPTFTQELSPEQQEVFDLVHEHFTLHNELMKDPHSDWQPLINTVDGEALQSVLTLFGRLRTNNEKRVGDEIFHVHEVGDIKTDGSIATATVSLCTDSADSDVIDVETGDSVMVVELPLILQWEVHVRQEADRVWMIHEFLNESASTCDSG